MISEEGYERPTRLVWIGSTKKDLMGFPEDVMRGMGYALWLAQVGDKAANARQMHGALRDVLEIADSDESGTYRVMYTVRFGDVVYVLHAFQKKSKSGTSTPKIELDLVAARLNAARKYHETHGI